MVWSYSGLNPRSARVSLLRHEWPDGAHVRTFLGQHVLWHPVEQGGPHLTAARLQPYRQQGDHEMDEILSWLDKEGRTLQAGHDLLDLCHKVASGNGIAGSLADDAIAKFHDKYTHHVPSWVDWAQVERGQQVFLAYMPSFGASLYYRSLVPGFALPMIAQVLLQTRRLTPPATKQVAQTRLLDTGAFLALVMQPDALRPGNDGWKAALQVRVLHAKIRRSILQQGNWNVNRLGIPINQEDAAATLLAFSTNTLLGAEMILGWPLPRQERIDYLALWRYLGWLLGVDTESDSNTSEQMPPLDPCGPGWHPSCLDPVAHANAMLQSMIMHLMHPNKASIVVARHLLKQGRRTDVDEPTLQNDRRWYEFRCLHCRRFVGDELADALELPAPTGFWRYWRVWLWSTVYLTVLTWYTVAALPWSPLRGILVRWHRAQMAKFAQEWTNQYRDRASKELGGDLPACPFAMLPIPELKKLERSSS